MLVYTFVRFITGRMNTKLNSIVAIALTAFIALSAFPLTTFGAEETKPAAAPPKADVAKRQAQANAAAAKIKGNKSDLDRLVKAVKAKDEREAQAVLKKNGFDASDMKLSMREEKSKKKPGDKEPKTSARFDITITFRCCPPILIIVIRGSV